MRKRVFKVVLGVVGLAVGVVAVLALREATLSTHQPLPQASEIELVLKAREKAGEQGQTLDEKVQAQVLNCRLEVTSDLVGDIEAQGDGLYRAVLAPSMDETNRRQFRGCIEDWVIDGTWLDVIRLEPIS